MANAADVQSLFLQVDASVELLRRNLAAGEQPLDRFEQRANRMATSVDKSIAQMGSRFGEFAKLAESAADRAQRSFDASFSQIQKMAATAVSMPSVKGGGLNLGAAETRQAADAARMEAQALGLIEKAALAAAAGEGVMTAETRLYIQAATAARIEGERRAAELMREAGALERLEIETRTARAGQQLMVVGHRNVIASQGQQRQSTMMLGQQTQDFFVQVMSGQSVTTAFVQQIGQAAFAVQGMGGKLSGVAAFLSSGWGAATLVGATVLIPLVSKILEQNHALDDAVDKLKKEAEQTALNDRAHAIFSKTIEGQIDAQRKLNDELDRSILTQRQLLQMKVYDAQKLVRDNQDDRPGLAAQIKRQQALVDDYNRQIANPGVRSPDATLALVAVAGRAERELNRLKALLGDLDASIVKGQRAVREAQQPLIQRDVETALDRRAAATERYTAALGRLNQQLAIGRGNAENRPVQQADGSFRQVRLTGIDQKQYQAELTRITATREAAYKAEAGRKKAENSTSRSPQQVFQDFQSELAARGIQRAAGRTGYRSAQDQHQIHAAGESPLDGYKRVSRHQSWQALDPTRASANDKAAYEAAQAAGLKGFKIVNESGGRKHYEWSGAGKKGDVDAAGSEAMARRIETAQNAILSDQISYAEQERQARRRLLDAQGRSATTEEERDRLAREEIDADFGAQKTKIAAQLARKDLKPDEAASLDRMNEQARDQRLTNIKIERARQQIAAGYDAEGQSAETKIAMLRIEGDMAVTAADRRRIATQMLELEQEKRRRALERVRDTSDDPNEVQRARDALTALPAQEGAERAALDQRNAGPVQQYVTDLRASVGDMGNALEGAAVRGFGALENSAGRAAAKLLGVRGALGGIIGDLIQIAIRKIALEAIGGGSILSAFGLAGGGKVEGKAGGGKISGPGTGTSDSILAMLGSKPIMLSNGESIVTAEATAKFWPVIDAMNKGRIKGYAGGGLPSMSLPTAPRLPSFGRSGFGPSNGGGDTLLVKVDKSELFDVHVQRVAGPMAQAAAVGGSQMALQEIAEQQSQALS